MSEKTATYVAPNSLRDFHRSDKFVRTIIGPIGSGKSVACVNEMLMKSLVQEPFEGVRRTRWAVVRNSYRELADTTMETFFQWVPKGLGVMSVINNKFTLKLALGDGTSVEAEFLFRALAKPSDIKKLLSLEITGMFMNECRELPKAVLDMGSGRCGRYPAKFQGGASWHGVIMDTNPPDTDSWFYRLFEEDLPSNAAIFHQPSGRSPEAENVENLPKDYYKNLELGKTDDWVRVYVDGLYGFLADGRPVYPEFKEDLHVAREDIKVDPNRTLYVGIDFGLTPAAAIGQISATGQLRLIDELVTFDMGAVSFGKLLKEKLSTHPYDACKDVEIWADPAGEQRAQTDEVTPFMILMEQGVSAWPTHTNDPTIRREVVADKLMRLDFSGEPAFIISPKASMTRKSFAGGYCYKRVQVSGEERYKDVPNKGKFSHIGDAVQYLALGALGDGEVIGGYGDQPLDYSEINRMIV